MCVCILSPWQVRFAFKNLVDFLDLFLRFHQLPAAAAPTTGNQTRRRCCARKCYSPPPQPHTLPRDDNLLAAWRALPHAAAAECRANNDDEG